MTRYVWPLPAGPDAARLGRRAVRQACRDCLPGHLCRSAGTALCEDAELVTSELVGNAVRHGDRAGLELRLQLDDRELTVAVFDRGLGRPRIRHPGLDEEGGRGMVLVEALSSGWGVRAEDSGKIVWATFALADRAAAPSAAG